MYHRLKQNRDTRFTISYLNYISSSKNVIYRIILNFFRKSARSGFCFSSGEYKSRLGWFQGTEGERREGQRDRGAEQEREGEGEEGSVTEKRERDREERRRARVITCSASDDQRTSELKASMGHKNVWNSHPRKYGLGSHPW